MIPASASPICWVFCASAAAGVRVVGAGAGGGARCCRGGVGADAAVGVCVLGVVRCVVARPFFFPPVRPALRPPPFPPPPPDPPPPADSHAPPSDLATHG